MVTVAKYAHDDASVVVIVGSGAGGGVLANELAQRGVKVVCLEAGPRLLPEDYINDEWDSFAQLSWGEPRSTSGSWRVAQDFPDLPAWIVKAVGGTSIHWAGASLRLQEHEFKARTTYGQVDGANLLDWPITRADLDPYYDLAEKKLGVTRTNNFPGLPGNNNYKVLEKGAKASGYKEVSTGHMGINSVDNDDRPACQQTGFCFQGCKWGAKWSAAYTDIPKGEATGLLELRDQCRATRIEHDDKGRATGVRYIDKDGKEQFQKARVVCVAGNSIESPRLLLASASEMFPDGLANRSGQVGRNYMRHTTGSVFAVFEKPVKFWRGTIMAGIVQDEVGHDPKRGYVGGYEMETISLGLPFTAAFVNPGGWGRSFTSILDDYDKLAAMWIVGEDMPQETNRITLNHAVKDKFGQPVANVHYDDHANDLAMRAHAYEAGEKIYRAAGALRTIPVPPYPSTHNLGTNRMSENPRDGVVNKWGRAHDVPNLYVSDGSVFTTSAAENPTLTIVSLAIRQAEHIAGQLQKNAI